MVDEDFAFPESPEQRKARLARYDAEWNALPTEERARIENMAPAEKEQRDRQIMLNWLEGMQRVADKALISFDGKDRPLVHGGQGRENEVLTDSVIDFYREIKEALVEKADAYRNGAPLPWQQE